MFYKLMMALSQIGTVLSNSRNTAQPGMPNTTECLPNPYTLWGGLNLARLDADKITFQARIDEVIQRQESKLARLRTQRESQWFKMTQSNKTLKEMTEHQLKAKSLTAQIEEETLQAEALLRFKEKILICMDEFIEALKEMHLPDGDVDAKRIRYDKSYHAVVDCLVEVDAFRKNKNSEKMNTGIVLWSKIHQRYAELLAEVSGRLTLESSLAGFLFDKISWGTQWTIDPTAPMKAFWIRMSREITKVAQGNSVIVHVFRGIDPRSAFWTEEANNIIEMIKTGEVTALYLNVHAYKEGKKDRVMFLRDTLPRPDLLKEANYNDAYIFTKEPQKLYFIRNGQAKELVIDASFMASHSDMMSQMKDDHRPVEKINVGKVAYKHLHKVIANNPGHRGTKVLKPPKEPIKITTLEELEKYLLIPDEAYIDEQNKWQRLQRVKLIAPRGFRNMVSAHKRKDEFGVSDLEKSIQEFRASKAAESALTPSQKDALAAQQAAKNNNSQRSNATVKVNEAIIIYDSKRCINIATEQADSQVALKQINVNQEGLEDGPLAPANFFALSDTINEAINATDKAVINRWIYFGIACALHDLFDESGNIRKEMQEHLINKKLLRKRPTLQEINQLKPYLISYYFSHSGFINQIDRGTDSGTIDKNNVPELLAAINSKLAGINSVDSDYIDKIKRKINKSLPDDVHAPKLQKAIRSFNLISSKQSSSRQLSTRQLSSKQQQITPATEKEIALTKNPIVEKVEEKTSLSTRFFGFVKRHKKAILIGAFVASVIALGLVSFGVLSIAEVVVGTGVFALASTSVASVLSACGGYIAAHIGLTALAVGTKAAIGSGAIALGATAFGSTAGAIKGLVSDQIDNTENQNAAKKREQKQKQTIVDKNNENCGNADASPSLGANDNKLSDHTNRLFPPSVPNQVAIPPSSSLEVGAASAHSLSANEKARG